MKAYKITFKTDVKNGTHFWNLLAQFFMDKIIGINVTIKGIEATWEIDAKYTPNFDDWDEFLMNTKMYARMSKLVDNDKLHESFEDQLAKDAADDEKAINSNNDWTADLDGYDNLSNESAMANEAYNDMLDDEEGEVEGDIEEF